jgi:cell wall-associated NlpC family hydrolase
VVFECRGLFRASSRLFAAGITACALLALAADRASGAPSQSQISATESQVSSLEATIAHEQQESAALDQEYLTAVQTAQQDQAALAKTKQTLGVIVSHVKIDRARLRKDAVTALVLDAPQGSATALFTLSPWQQNDRNLYTNTAVGNIDAVEATLHIEQSKLVTTESQQQSEEQLATTAAGQVQSLEVANQNATTADQATLAQIKGNLATQIAQYAEAQAQQEEAAAAAARTNSAAQAASRSATADAAVADQLGGTSVASAAAGAANGAASSGGSTSVSGSAVGSASGDAAVQAAESQLGVPYVWGGESPGNGFDCSGLTQWSWQQAGVSIPRTAAEQWNATTHVALNALEPGDLLFYYDLDDDNQVDHVVMYVGSGPYGDQTIIQAPYTGASVEYAPLFTGGLVGAGRP